MKVTRCVFVRGRVATAYVAAGHAKTQVDPMAANAKAVFTTVCAGFYFSNLIKMAADFIHIFSFLAINCHLKR
jgi:hypothetical protein